MNEDDIRKRKPSFNVYIHCNGHTFKFDDVKILERLVNVRRQLERILTINQNNVP